MNKGIALATGDVVGTVNADDFFADVNVLDDVAEVSAEQDAEVLYGDLDYVDSNDKVIRKWRSGKYSKGLFNWGWMPPAPYVLLQKELI